MCIVLELRNHTVRCAYTGDVKKISFDALHENLVVSCLKA